MNQASFEYDQFRKKTREVTSFLQQFESRENELAEADIDRLRLSMKLLTNLAGNIDAFETTKLKFRPNQIHGLQNLRGFLANLGYGNLRGYFQQPTGAGKTIFFGAVVKMLNVKSLILVPKTVLLEQTAESFTEMLGIAEENIGIVGDQTRQLGRKFTISTYQSHTSNMKKDDDYARLMLDVELVICDEAHRSLGEKTQNTLEVFDYSEDEELTEEEMQEEQELLDNAEQYIGKSALVLGFTATPQLRIKQVEKHFDTLISRISYEELIGIGILVPLKVFQDSAYLEPDEVDYITEEEEGKILERENVYRKLLQRFTNQRAEQLAGIQLNPAVFCVNIEECKKFQQVAAEFGHKSMIITSKIGKNSLEEAEGKLLKGEIDFIITVNKLTEGWDFPPLNTVILARASRSPAIIIQAVGRGMRSDENKDNCYVFEANWRVKTNNVVESVEKAAQTKHTSLALNDSEGTMRAKKALTIAQALADLGENVAAICSGAEGVLEFIHSIEVNKNGIGKITINGEEIEVVARCQAAADYYDMSHTTLAKYLEEINAIPGYEARLGTNTAPIYKKSEVDELFSYLRVNENGRCTITIEDEEIEVVARCRLAANSYGISSKFLNKKLKDLTPVPGYEAKLGGQLLPVYEKSEVDKLFSHMVKADENGIGTITIDGEEIEVVACNGASADCYGVSSSTFVKRIKTLDPLPDYEVMSGTHIVAVYKKSEVDKLFPRIIKADENGIGAVIIGAEEIEVVGSCQAASDHYGVSHTTLLKKLKTLTPVAGYEVKTGPTSSPVYKKSEVDTLFPYIKVDENGIGTVTIDGEEIKVVARCQGSANYYDTSMGTLSNKVKTLTTVPGYEAKLGIRPTDLYKKNEVDALFPKVEIVETDENGIGTVTIEGKEIEVVACMADTVKYYNTSKSTLLTKLKTLTPIPNYVAKAGGHPVALYKKSEADTLFPRETIKIEMNENGMGMVRMDGEETEVVANGNAAARYYGVTRKTIREKLKKLTPVPGYKAKSGSQSTSIYKKSEVDILFEK